MFLSYTKLFLETIKHYSSFLSPFCTKTAQYILKIKNIPENGQYLEKEDWEKGDRPAAISDVIVVDALILNVLYDYHRVEGIERVTTTWEAGVGDRGSGEGVGRARGRRVEVVTKNRRGSVGSTAVHRS